MNYTTTITSRSQITIPKTVREKLGIKNAVATLGTAIGFDHLKVLLRYTRDITFCFDGDLAGKKAAWRALETCLPLLRDGLQTRFIFLPEAEDPDSFVRKNKDPDRDCTNKG